jgi:hypothetical protein
MPIETPAAGPPSVGMTHPAERGAALLPTLVAAQAGDPGARMERVADGVYAIIHENATEEWPHGNTGVIVGDDAVAVVDATYLPLVGGAPAARPQRPAAAGGAGGAGRAPGGVTVWLPAERVLFSGDILAVDPYPYTGASWPVPWTGVLRELEGIPVAALVPGHGPVMRDHGNTRLVRELMEAVVTRVDSAARAGLTLEQAQDSVTLEDFRTRFPTGDPAAHREDWRVTMRALVERAWRGVRGQG